MWHDQLLFRRFPNCAAPFPEDALRVVNYRSSGIIYRLILCFSPNLWRPNRRLSELVDKFARRMIPKSKIPPIPQKLALSLLPPNCDPDKLCDNNRKTSSIVEELAHLIVGGCTKLREVDWKSRGKQLLVFMLKGTVCPGFAWDSGMACFAIYRYFHIWSYGKESIIEVFTANTVFIDTFP